MTTEDEVMRLLRRADPDRGGAHAPSLDGTEYLAALHTRSTTVTLTDTEPTPPGAKHRHRWPIVAVAAAAVVAVGVGGLVIATRDDDQTDDVPANQPTTVAPTTVGEQSLQAAQPPVEFTAWVSAGPEVHPETTQEVAVSLPDGEMTITRQRGVTWNPSLHDMSDPRLEGTLYEARDEDTYTLPGNEKGPHFGVRTYRIENDEGAWQGSAVSLESTDGRYYNGPYVMTGEGAYEGLTAILVNPDQSDRFTGYIIEGTIPAPPVPQTGG